MQDAQNSALKTNVVFENEARDRLYAGIKVAADAVTATLGPRGKTVLIQSNAQAPIITKDGVTVSKAINLKDPIERMGANLVREAASRTNDVAGDGTTTSTALAHALIAEGRKLMSTGYDARGLRDGIVEATRDVIDHVTRHATKLTTREQIVSIATISANGDGGIGSIVAGAFERVGVDGIVTVEDAKSTNTVLEIVEGMQFERGYLSPYFVTNQEKMVAVHNDCRVLVSAAKVSTLQDLLPVLESVHRQGTSLLIIADDIEGEALQALVLNRVKANLNVVAVKAPGYGNNRTAILEDICTLTGAKLASASTGIALKDAVPALGTCKRAVVDAKSTIIVGLAKHGDEVQARIGDLKSQLQNPTLSMDEVNMLQQRIARLAGGVAVVKVGGVTEMEMIERKYRIEDALHATRAAIAEGIVPGGGLSLFRAARDLAKVHNSTGTAHDVGYAAVLAACLEPLAKIVRNAGKSSDVVIDNLDRQGNERTGYDAATDSYIDLEAAGIIDPVKVTRCALENASSVALLYVSLGTIISNDEEASLQREGT